MFIAGGLTLPLFAHTLMDLDSTPHQQMDLTLDPVYRRPYKFAQLTPFGSDAQCHQMSTVEDIDLKVRQNIEHLKLRQNIEHVSLDRFQRDYESREK